MKISKLHSWKLTFADAIALQRKMSEQVACGPPLNDLQTIAGADVSYNRWSPTLYASVVVLKMPDLTVIEERTAADVAFPYRTGLLSFREAPALLTAFRKLRNQPDVVMIDGHGLAHPRRFGIACHLDHWLGIPTIGCAKSRLIGEFDEPSGDAWSSSSLRAGTEVVGCVVRSKQNCKPLFVSIGNRIDQASAVRIVQRTTLRHRIPEPTRLAHNAVNRFRRKHLGLVLET